MSVAGNLWQLGKPSSIACRPITKAKATTALKLCLRVVKLAKSVKPEDVSKALKGAQINSIYGVVTMRAVDNQWMQPNYVSRVKMVDGKLRPVIEQTFIPCLIPAPSPLCKM